MQHVLPSASAPEKGAFLPARNIPPRNNPGLQATEMAPKLFSRNNVKSHFYAVTGLPRSRCTGTWACISGRRTPRWRPRTRGDGRNTLGRSAQEGMWWPTSGMCHGWNHALAQLLQGLCIDAYGCMHPCIHGYAHLLWGVCIDAYGSMHGCIRGYAHLLGGACSHAYGSMHRCIRAYAHLLWGVCTPAIGRMHRCIR